MVIFHSLLLFAQIYLTVYILDRQSVQREQIREIKRELALIRGRLLVLEARTQIVRTKLEQAEDALCNLLEQRYLTDEVVQ